ncbi:crossover junction endodeoxyribonuclease RuvC [Desulfurispirillum indicum]|uniref:Crossover junction endodeoxyribonuclease RuvC n=1 Tax=Desulfurispirillum indicum (strain ATCC BAA-1389 / DSM 22839 / S5) TaxID=653733 RepID=E6W402_DESIS|nr:crossover junction endodeoxyribonuclease RuvC [Desulfurispirillum indicum]ADU65870.1 crossover junction endodeoxyribonuclease RuvC [Desulfurispirillum indicum S5]UCZ57806.1 crossover junction endodeoxyribonuclease RuvC [Desulfurispirillum indicum]
MILLGIDPGTRITGYGIVEARGNQLLHRAHGAIRPPVDLPFPQRMLHLQQGLNEVLREHSPAHVCIEEVFLAQNPQSALKLGHARGVLMITCLSQGLDVVELSALQIKQSVTGYGKAPKEQVGRMVQMLLSLATLPKPEDAADALAAAIALSQHIAHQQAIGRTNLRGAHR